MIREGSDITLIGWGAQLSIMEQACIDAEKVTGLTHGLCTKKFIFLTLLDGLEETINKLLESMSILKHGCCQLDLKIGAIIVHTFIVTI